MAISKKPCLAVFGSLKHEGLRGSVDSDSNMYRDF